MATAEELGGSLDVDVVGLVDLDFKNESDFFDFDSGGEFGLFGEAGAALHTTTATTTTTTSATATTTPLASPPVALLSTSPAAGISSGCNSSQAHATNSFKKSGGSSKSKSHWTDIERDLFQKGLELFGANWNRLSSFISSKTPGQVRSYYKKWMEVASVVQEADTLGETLVYMPAEAVCISTDLEDPLGLIETATTTVTTTPLSPRRTKSGYSRSKVSKVHENIDPIYFKHSDEIAVPSVGEECVIEQCGYVVGSPDSGKGKERKSASGPKKSGKSKKNGTSLHKSQSPFKVKAHKQKHKAKRKKMKVAVNQNQMEKKSIKPTETVSKVVSGPPMAQLGQVVHLVKDEVEESDVDIDVSDDEQLVIIDKSPTDENFSTKVEESKNLDVMDECGEVKDVVHSRVEGIGSEGRKQHVFTFPQPLTEHELDLEGITEEERIVHFEYFDGKGVKTPERYMKIRNYLINFWKQIKPKYVRKTAVRAGLKNCGDVNSISKVHEYLEKVGAINFQCPESNYSSPLIIGIKPKEKPHIPSKPVVKVDRSEMTRQKQKKKLDMSLCEGGGLTISHDESGAIVDACHIPEAPRNRTNSGGNRGGPRTEQFKLVRCLEHDPDTPAPFSVIMHAHALITMDLHAHTSLAEVMGLLGGYFDPTSHTMHVTVAVPTQAVSSGVECDMCPVSQSAACTTIHEGGVQVVGWYHSHPTFPPNPSLQDMDTQSQMQQWFARQDAHFLGIIVSPFCPTNRSEASHIRCIILDKPPHSQEDKDSTKVPYKLFWSVSEVMPGAWEEVCQGVRKVVTGARDDPMAVDWRGEWRGQVTNWEKAIASLNHHLPHYLHGPLQSVRTTFLGAVRECLDA
ncbi:histone H2A deubiquitinase MYSM1-like [Eriocheir sinensis]|uniref:histone H2A deubiquitinase MYSM1-like n=1 Tax=Eriocheir sinensis TaxID=95602 RepID=UPI0021CAAFC0|nr:histone H2A deubiquitinase MYSM1-like [Eriocheir sinensis]